jgi:hypothetical protein
MLVSHPRSSAFIGGWLFFSQPLRIAGSPEQIASKCATYSVTWLAEIPETGIPNY